MSLSRLDFPWCSRVKLPVQCWKNSHSIHKVTSFLQVWGKRLQVTQSKLNDSPVNTCSYKSTLLIFIFSWQACSMQTFLSDVIYYRVGLQNTSDCVLGEDGRCVLTYTGIASLKYDFRDLLPSWCCFKFKITNKEA